MLSREFRGRTVEEAIQTALKELRAKREEVEITVIKKGRPGLFGLGGEEAVIRVETAGDSSPVSQAQEELETLLRLMSIQARVYPVPPPGGLGLSAKLVALDIRGQDLGCLIGRRGQTLASLQYVLNLMLSRRLKDCAPIMVDVEGYRKRRYEDLSALALRLTEQVRREGQPMALEPMPPFERRVVHLVLSHLPDIATESVGEGNLRKVVIRLRQGGGVER